MRMDVAEMGADPANAWRFALRLASSMEGLLIQYRRALGVSMTELQAVLALWDGGRMSMTDLGARIALSRAAVTTLADHVEQLGLIERMPDPGDRRRILLAVSAKAEAKLHEVTASLQERLADIAGADPKAWASFAAGAAAARVAIKDETAELRATDFDARGNRPKRKVEVEDLGGW
jgi:DNA-binding MarR family transcriptional regulator